MTKLRLWLAKKLLPKGYAIWTYGRPNEDGVDEPIICNAFDD